MGSEMCIRDRANSNIDTSQIRLPGYSAPFRHDTVEQGNKEVAEFVAMYVQRLLVPLSIFQVLKLFVKRSGYILLR